MSFDSTTNTSWTAPDDFEQALTILILEAFAAGASLEQTWEISSESAYVPDWRVTIEKTTDAELPTNHDAFVDE